MVTGLGFEQRKCAHRGYIYDQAHPIRHAGCNPTCFNRHGHCKSPRRQQPTPSDYNGAPPGKPTTTLHAVLALNLEGSERRQTLNFSLLENVLWAIGFVGNSTLLCVLLLKKRARYFPVFTTYIGFEVVETITLYRISHSGSSHAYFISYWAFAAGDYIGQIAVIFEIARDVLRPTGAWVTDARKSFLFWAFIGTVAAALIATVIAPPGRTGLELWAVRSSVFTSFLTCEVFLAMSAAANRLGLQWRNHVMSLGQGLTFWATIALLGDIGHFSTGWRKDLRVFDTVRSCAYIIAVAFWIVTFVLPERRRSPPSAEMQLYLADLHKSVEADLSALDPERKPLP